jgi:hypothetical protein
MLKFFEIFFCSKKFFLVKETEATFGTNLRTFYLSKWNNYSARDPMYLPSQLSHTCTTSQVTIGRERKCQSGRAQSCPIWGLQKTLVEVPLGNTYVRNGIQSPKSCWYTDTCVVAQYFVVPISTHFHELRKQQVCFIPVMFVDLCKTQ